MSFRVLQLGPIPPPEGGVSRHIAALKDTLESLGHRVTLVATTRNRLADRDDANVYPRTPFELVSTLRKSDADIFHLHVGGDINFRVLALAFAVATTGTRSVMTMHSGGFPAAIASGGRFRKKITTYVLGKFDRVLAVSEGISDALRGLGLPTDQVKMIPPYALRKPNPSIRPEGALADFVATHTPLLVAVGGLEPEYTPLEQIAAVTELLAEFPDLGLVIVGTGSLMADAETAVANAGLAENVLLAGALEHELSLHLLANADVSLRTTHFDGDAISVRESLFLGTPVVATRAGSRPDGVHFIDECSPAAIVRGIREVLSLPKMPKGSSPDDLSQIEHIVSLYEELIAS
ncbi:MAG: group 1 glycosyl transferase [Acidobacteria bacterium OLB17]|nr:MAG: group 1 glycosyl transferase [Acidobacteria bacterium OLB17]MCZ2389985.1 glycosyltransferase family 4 protein [Acidobacteriota bacterium]